jgi:hypothetical protein
VDGTVSGSTITLSGKAVTLNASALGTPLYLDGVQQASALLTVNLLPGRHSFWSGGSTQSFDIANDGTLTLVNPLLGTVSGSTLTITGPTGSGSTLTLG